MSIVITNISNTFSEKGLQGYVLKINNKEICRFTHIREEGLSQCLYRAFLETGGDDEIKRLEAEVERMKCCGNCKWCNSLKDNCFDARNNICDNWQSDGLTQERRK